MDEIRSRKFILVSCKYFENCDRVASVINSKQWIELEAVISKSEDQKAKAFLQALKNMILADYQSAINNLNSLDDKDFDCQVKILKMDCYHELKNSYVNYEKGYQEAVDCSNYEAIRSIALKRYRFLKYEN